MITNDTESSRKDIVKHYYHRFEIEEFFRDAKHILGFEYLHFKTIQGLTIALWFALLTCWFFALVGARLTNAQEAERARWGLSRFRYVYEVLMRELWQAAETATLAASSGTV